MKTSGVLSLASFPEEFFMASAATTLRDDEEGLRSEV
jgi:hypothetical protein